MNTKRWQWLKRLPAALAAPAREPAELARLILTAQRNVIMPARLVTVGVVLYYLYSSPWQTSVSNTYGVVFETIRMVVVACALFMAAVGAVFYVVRRFPPEAVQWFVFAVGLADGVCLAGVTVLTSGFESVFYWVFPVLILVNAISIPLATPQIVLNLLLCVFFLLAGHIEANAKPELELGSLSSNIPRRNQGPRIAPEDLDSPEAVARWLKSAPAPVDRLLAAVLSQTSRSALDASLETNDARTNLQDTLAADLNRIFHRPTRYIPSQDPGQEPVETIASPYVLRVAVLLLLTFCCYGVQVLAARERRIAEEREEFLVRTAQLHSAGRLAAEVAHQIKNPLAIINNVTYSLHKNLKNQKVEAAQVEMIREEIAKADRIITQIMGYAQLSEGRVEKIEVVEEINRAIGEIFPPALPTQIKLHRQFDDFFPPVMMHRRHLAEAVANLLQNARDALGQHGNISVIARSLGDYSVEIIVRDDGPGIPADTVEKVFEAYYTTKPRGTGLGLAVVKHNVELYGGTVKVESALGRGAKFVLQFPARTLMRLGQ